MGDKYETPYDSGGGDGPRSLQMYPLPWRVVRDDADPYDYMVVAANDEEVFYISGNRGFDNRFLRVAEFIAAAVNGLADTRVSGSGVTVMTRGPFGGATFEHYGAHAMRQPDGAVVFGWRDISALGGVTHEHRYRYADDGTYLGSQFTDCPGPSCYWSKWNEGRGWEMSQEAKP